MKPSNQDIRQEVEEVIAERQDSFEDEEKEEIIEKVVERIEDKDSVEAPNDNDIDRRSFLKMMGLGAGGLAFSSMASAEFFKLGSGGSGGSGGSQNLSSVLSEGNSAGSYNINMNGNDINDVNSISGSPDADLMYFTPGSKGNYTVRYDTDDFRFYNGGTGSAGNVMWLRHGGNVEIPSGSLSVKGNTVWHQGNDGGGSGLNADMVDGQHASDIGGSFAMETGSYETGGGGADQYTTISFSNKYSAAATSCGIQDANDSNQWGGTYTANRDAAWWEWTTDGSGNIDGMIIRYDDGGNAGSDIVWHVFGETV